MSRLFAWIALVGLTIAGCSPQVSTQRKEEVKGPGGTTTTTDTHTVESSGENPPANAQGEKAK